MSDAFDLSDLGIAVSKPTQPSAKHSMLVYGRTRVGKTSFAASAADVEGMYPILWIATEDGTASFAGQYDEDRIDVVQAQTWDTVQTILNAVLNNETKYKTIVVDTLGQLQEIVKREYLAANDGKGDFSMWDKINKAVVLTVDSLHNSRYNSIFIAHNDKVQDGVDGKVYIAPYFLGKKSSVDIPKIVDTIAYMYKSDEEDENGNAVRKLLLTAVDKIDAGSRLEHVLPPIIATPTMAKFMAPIFAAVKK